MMTDDEHIKDIIKELKKTDPNLEENMRLGRYMPRCNGNRVVFRGKDKWIEFKEELIYNTIGNPFFWLIVVLGIIALSL